MGKIRLRNNVPYSSVTINRLLNDGRPCSELLQVAENVQSFLAPCFGISGKYHW